MKIGAIAAAYGSTEKTTHRNEPAHWLGVLALEGFYSAFPRTMRPALTSST